MRKLDESMSSTVKKNESIDSLARLYNRMRAVAKGLKTTDDNYAEEIATIEADINRLDPSEKETAMVGLERIKQLNQGRSTDKEIEREARVKPSISDADKSLLDSKARPNNYTVECPYCNEDIEYTFDPLGEISDDIKISPAGQYIVDCPNCGDHIQVSPAPLDLVVVDIQKQTEHGFFFKVMDRPTARTCWLSGFINDDRQWEFDYLNYDINLNTRNGLIENAFQRDLDAYTNELGNFVYEIAEKYRKQNK